jgi:hypothetical protein
VHNTDHHKRGGFKDAPTSARTKGRKMNVPRNTATKDPTVMVRLSQVAPEHRATVEAELAAKREAQRVPKVRATVTLDDTMVNTQERMSRGPDSEARDGVRNTTPLHPELKVIPLEDADTDYSNTADKTVPTTQVYPDFVPASDGDDVDVLGGLFNRRRAKR